MELAYLFGNPNLSVTGILVFITCIASYLAESDQTHRTKIKYLFNPGWIEKRQEYYRFITSGFIHDGYIHLIFNMIAFYGFGLSVEFYFYVTYGNLGVLLYILFYFSAIAVASLPDFLKYRHSEYYNALGASGGVSAIVFGHILFNPTGGIGFILLPGSLPGFLFAILYLFYTDYMARNGQDRIAHNAHFFGSMYGVVFCAVLFPNAIWDFFSQIMAWRGFF